MRTARHSTLSILSASLLISSITLSAHAENKQSTHHYNEPTRGFFLEHGMVSGTGHASVELHSGSAGLSTGGGIRLGLPNSELILNGGKSTYDKNEALLKWAMPDFKPNAETKNVIKWSAIGGISQLGIENISVNNTNFNHLNQTNIKLGAAATIKADAGTFTVSPLLIYTHGDLADETFAELGFGAYVGVIDTKAGLFSLGFEANFTSQSHTNNQFTLGGRWAYNERVNLDIIPVVLQNNNFTSFPGLVRLNVVF